MTDALIAPYRAVRTGPLVMTSPVITAGGMALRTPAWEAPYMPYPDGQGTLVWEGRLFGFPVPAAGGNVVYAAADITHWVSDPSAFTSVTAQMYANGVAAGSPATLTLSATPVTQTVATKTGVPAANLPQLSVRVTWQQSAQGLAYVSRARGHASWSFANAAAPWSVTPHAVIMTPPTVRTLPSGGLFIAGII